MLAREDWGMERSLNKRRENKEKGRKEYREV
jgi:hypothetical protein